jgi:hypothetical protein
MKPKTVEKLSSARQRATSTKRSLNTTRRKRGPKSGSAAVSAAHASARRTRRDGPSRVKGSVGSMTTLSPTDEYPGMV